MGFKLPKLPGVPSLPSISQITSNPGDALKNVARQGFAVGDTFGIGRNIMPLFDKAPKPPSAGEDPNVTALRERLFGEAQDFEKGLPGYQQQAGNQIQREGDMALESGLKGTKQNFNRRGLLYSGLREAGEQGVRGKVASEMANQKAQSNQDLNKMATAKYQKAAQVGLQSYQDSINREAEIAGINLQNQVARAQIMQQLGQTGGYLGATAYSNYSKRPAPKYTGAWSDGPQPNYSSDFRSGNLRADSYYG